MIVAKGEYNRTNNTLSETISFTYVFKNDDTNNKKIISPVFDGGYEEELKMIIRDAPWHTKLVQKPYNSKILCLQKQSLCLDRT